jgi:pimeloyl-ACP methyl ester carboxylesterase
MGDALQRFVKQTHSHRRIGFARRWRAPAADILSLDPAAMRQAMFGDRTAAVAIETIPDTPKADAIVSTILARRALARFGWQFPDNPRLLRYLYRVKVPTMIIWGERDRYVSLSHASAYHDGIAASKLKTVTNSGHLPHVEAPGMCADIIIDFLRNSATNP